MVFYAGKLVERRNGTVVPTLAQCALPRTRQRASFFV